MKICILVGVLATFSLTDQAAFFYTGISMKCSHEFDEGSADFQACLFENIDVMDDDGKVDKGKLEELLTEEFSNAELAHNVTEKCAKDKEDPASTADELFSCLSDNYVDVDSSY